MTRHAKYTPPAPLEAPDDLAALVAAHLACGPGREWGRTLMAIQRWTYGRRVRLYQTYVLADGHHVTLSDSLPKIGRRSGPLPLKGGSGSNRGANENGFIRQG